MEPGTQGIANPKGAGLLDEDQECGLEGVMGVVRVGELGAADPQDHRAVTFDQSLEGEFGDFAGAGRESFQ